MAEIHNKNARFRQVVNLPDMTGVVYHAEDVPSQEAAVWAELNGAGRIVVCFSSDLAVYLTPGQAEAVESGIARARKQLTNATPDPAPQAPRPDPFAEATRECEEIAVELQSIFASCGEDCRGQLLRSLVDWVLRDRDVTRQRADDTFYERSARSVT